MKDGALDEAQAKLHKKTKNGSTATIRTELQLEPEHENRDKARS